MNHVPTSIRKAEVLARAVVGGCPPACGDPEDARKEEELLTPILAFAIADAPSPSDDGVTLLDACAFALDFLRDSCLGVREADLGLIIGQRFGDNPPADMAEARNAWSALGRGKNQVADARVAASALSHLSRFVSGAVVDRIADSAVAPERDGIRTLFAD